MRRTLDRSRLTTLLTVSALIGSSFALSAPAFAADPDQGRGARMVNAGDHQGVSDGQGTRGKVNPRELSTKAPTKRPTMTLDKPALPGRAAAEPTSSPRLPSAVAAAPVQAIETSNRQPPGRGNPASIRPGYPAVCHARRAPGDGRVTHRDDYAGPPTSSSTCRATSSSGTLKAQTVVPEE